MSRSPYPITAQLRVGALEAVAAVGGRLRCGRDVRRPHADGVGLTAHAPRCTVEVALGDAALVATDLDSALGLAARMEDDLLLVGTRWD